MLTSLSGNAIAAKARAIYGKRLTTTNYHDLMRMPTVSDVCIYLKTNTSYSKYLRNINEAAIHRGQLEDILKRSCMERYFSLLHYDFSGKKSFYHYVITDAEIDLILRAIMLMNSNSVENLISDIPSFLREYATFDFQELARVRNYEQLLQVLDKTPYVHILKRFQAPNGEISFKDCELALKTYYYRTLLDNIDKNFKGKTKKELREIVLIEIELLNISMVYRLRRHFKKSPPEIKSQLLPFHYRMSDQVLDDLLSAEHRTEYIEKMKLSRYNHRMQGVEFNYIEDYTKRLKYMVIRKMMRFSTNAPITFFALISLLRIEVENLIIIIESVRYNNKDEDVQKLLILE